jgi:hypothetical protein
MLAWKVRERHNESGYQEQQGRVDSRAPVKLDALFMGQEPEGKCAKNV